jgi:DNA-packaging protein gp3
MSEEKRKVGRPLKFSSVKEMQEKIDAYFEECDQKEDPYTITGLALALDTTRDVLLDYQEKDEYSNTIKKAKLKCENYAEKHLFKGKNGVVGAIFNLKNNYSRWVDKQEIVKTESPTIQIKRTRSEEKVSEE